MPSISAFNQSVLDAILIDTSLSAFTRQPAPARYAAIESHITNTCPNCYILAKGHCHTCHSYLAKRNSCFIVVNRSGNPQTYSLVQEFDAHTQLAAKYFVSLLPHTLTIDKHDPALAIPATQQTRPIHTTLSEPCTRRHLDNHQCPRIAPCNAVHLVDHTCPPQKPCQLEHLSNHTCSPQPCDRDHLADHTCEPIIVQNDNVLVTLNNIIDDEDQPPVPTTWTAIRELLTRTSPQPSPQLAPRRFYSHLNTSSQLDLSNFKPHETQRNRSTESLHSATALYVHENPSTESFNLDLQSSTAGLMSRSLSPTLSYPIERPTFSTMFSAPSKIPIPSAPSTSTARTNLARQKLNHIEHCTDPTICFSPHLHESMENDSPPTAPFRKIDITLDVQPDESSNSPFPDTSGFGKNIMTTSPTNVFSTHSSPPLVAATHTSFGFTSHPTASSPVPQPFQRPEPPSSGFTGFTSAFGNTTTPTTSFVHPTTSQPFAAYSNISPFSSSQPSMPLFGSRQPVPARSPINDNHQRRLDQKNTQTKARTEDPSS